MPVTPCEQASNASEEIIGWTPHENAQHRVSLPMLKLLPEIQIKGPNGEQVLDEMQPSLSVN